MLKLLHIYTLGLSDERTKNSKSTKKQTIFMSGRGGILSYWGMWTTENGTHIHIEGVVEWARAYLNVGC